MGKMPKQYECLNCGFISSRFRPMKFPGMTFATCFKCGGKVKEREEWLDWLRKAREEIYGPKAIESNESTKADKEV